MLFNTVMPWCQRASRCYLRVSPPPWVIGILHTGWHCPEWKWGSLCLTHRKFSERLGSICSQFSHPWVSLNPGFNIQRFLKESGHFKLSQLGDICHYSLMIAPLLGSLPMALALCSGLSDSLENQQVSWEPCASFNSATYFSDWYRALHNWMSEHLFDGYISNNNTIDTIMLHYGVLTLSAPVVNLSPVLSYFLNNPTK